MNKIYIPDGYKPVLDAYDTQRAIAYIKETFQTEFAHALNFAFAFISMLIVIVGVGGAN